jgi:hypothetical protein
VGLRGRADHEEVVRVRRIHALIAAAIDATDAEALDKIMTELRAALKDHVRRIRDLAAVKLRPVA